MFDSYNPAVLNEAIQKGAGGGGGTTVVANPEGTATGDLEKLQVGETIYEIPEGTTVVANPEGSATGDLEKLQIGETIYAFPIPISFSTTETKTGLIWDGKEVFAKLLKLGRADFTQSAGGKAFDYIISDSSIDNIIGGFGFLSTEYGKIPSGYTGYIDVTSAPAKYINFSMLSKHIQVASDVDYLSVTNPFSVEIGILYTKVVTESKKTTKKK